MSIQFRKYRTKVWLDTGTKQKRIVSPEGDQTEFLAIIKKVRQNFAKHSRSGPKAAELTKIQTAMQQPALKILGDIITRVASSVKMLERFVLIWYGVSIYYGSLPLTKNELSAEKRLLPPEIKIIAEVLAIVADLRDAAFLVQVLYCLNLSFFSICALPHTTVSIATFLAPLLVPTDGEDTGESIRPAHGL